MNKKSKLLSGVLWLCTILNLGYFVLLMISTGPTNGFNYVWLFVGIFLLAVALTFTFSKKGFSRIPKPLLVLLEAFVFVGLMAFILIEMCIVLHASKKPEQEADYLIVLGAKVNGTTPSKLLQFRIEKAYEYLNEHPSCKVIVSGGKGADEGISEAEAMRNGLLLLGIADERIYMEDRSTSTKENLDYSKAMFVSLGEDVKNLNIVVVTTDFHVMRAVKIAKKTGICQVEGLAAKQLWYLAPTNYAREFFALIKDWLVGNI